MRLRRGVFYVFFAAFINLLVNIVSGFLLPKYLSIDTYAQIALYQLYITYVGLLHLGFSDGIYLKYGGIDIKDVDKKSLYGELKTFKAFQVLITVVAVAVCLLIGDMFLLICALSILPINVGNYLRNVYQATGQFAKYARFTNISTVLILLVNLSLLFIIKSDYYFYYIAAYLCVWIVYWIFLEWELGKIANRVHSEVKLSYLVNNIKDGFSLMLGNFSLVVLSSIDRLFVKKIMGLTQFAFYSFAVNLQALINVFITPIATVMYNFFSKHKEYEKVMLIKNSMLLISAGLIAGVFLIKIIVEEFIPEYTPSLEVIFILCAAQFFTISIRTIFNNLYKVLRMQKRYLRVVLVAISLAILLIPSFYFIVNSMVAVASAMLLVCVAWFVICEYDFRQYRYDIKKLAFMATIITAFLFAGINLTALTGMAFYVTVVLIATLLLMKKEYKYLLSEAQSGFIKITKRKA